ncbi:MAG: hypothetical protein A3B13_02765 [Candidatus Liptonbacteria bacterium RIFCSPLOWO2_01_FULL_45_15]|uniref:histidine kinase n=1 Tax=Candidatus Liptonbacteria bacterium RIFCSPLOWO2_01_FULL_45_15 TaxID=1798649 RepID=A0A1G2CI89_9BACT|nr:MAG: hypothetical protein A3B13_02765 [Candidatus Liptonbacteria bacterium RIFCSPLOWO2_01_FULL_45_15]
MKFLLLSLIPAAAAIFISFYFLTILWASAAALLILSVLGLFFAYIKLSASGRKAKTAINAEVSESELESILNNFGDALIIYDDSFKVLFFNNAGEKLFMINEGEIVDITIGPEAVNDSRLRLIAQIVFPTLAPVMIPRSQAGTWPQIVDLSFSEPQLELRVSTSQLSQIPGKPARFLKVIQNRTHEVALLKTKSDFVSVASHQLKTPLTYIDWGLEALNGDETLSDSNKEIVSGTLKASKLLSEIVESLLDIARIEEGRFGYKFEEADISDFLGKILEQTMPEATRAGVRIYFEKPAVQLPKVFIDPQRLSLAISNLLDNGIRYNVKNGDVIVRASQAEGKPFIEVSVKDTGIGISPEEIEKLFVKFFRAANAIKSQTGGTGLGLYITKNIIEAHGGKIRAESELNRGTTFYFTLPTDQSLVPQREVPVEA